MEESAHYQHSTLRERIVEHVFVGDALRTLWRRGVVDVEVLRPEFDAHGYDLVMARGPIVRHIQFKTGTSPKPADVSVSQALAEKPSGCVKRFGGLINVTLQRPRLTVRSNAGTPVPIQGRSFRPFSPI